MNNFTRGGSPLKTLDLGGGSFDTLNPGAILKCKRYFAVAECSGKISGYHSGAIKFRNGDYLLIKRIDLRFQGKKTLWFQKGQIKELMDLRELMREGKPAGSIFMVAKGFINAITKRRFDYRFDVVEIGFNES